MLISAASSLASAAPPAPMPGFKRKRPVGISASAKRKKADVRMVGLRPTQKSKLLSVLKGHTTFTTTVARLSSTAIAATASVHCLTSSTAATTAISSSGQIIPLCDSASLNFVEIRGHLAIRAVDAAMAATSYPGDVRILVVRFNKPIAQPTAAGTLPPVTEVLESDNYNAFPIASDVQNGRFQILSDRNFRIDPFGMGAGATSSSMPAASQAVNYKVKVKRQVDFLSSTIGPGVNGNGGHFDSDQAAGQVSKGLLCMYVISNFSGASFAPYGTLNTRVQYTA